MATQEEHVLNLWTTEGITVVGFADHLLTHEDTLRAIEEQLGDLVDTIGADMLLDFRDVRSMSSSVLAILIPLQRRISRAGGELKLCNVARPLQEVFRVAGVERVLPIYDDEATALDSFQRRSPR